jgi:hypothetical protein
MAEGLKLGVFAGFFDDFFDDLILGLDFGAQQEHQDETYYVAFFHGRFCLGFENKARR